MRKCGYVMLALVMGIVLVGCSSTTDTPETPASTSDNGPSGQPLALNSSKKSLVHRRQQRRFNHHAHRQN